MRTCLSIFLILIWLPISFFSIWSTNFYKTFGKADFWLKNINQIGGSARLSQDLSSVLGSALSKGENPQLTKMLQETFGETITPSQLSRQIEELLRGGQLFLEGKEKTLPSLNLEQFQQSFLAQSGIPKEAKQTLFKDMPKDFNIPSQASEGVSDFARIFRFAWLVGLVVSFLLLLLIFLLGQGLRGKLMMTGIALLLASGLVLLSLLIFALTDRFLAEELRRFDPSLSVLKDLLRDLVTQIFKGIRSLKLVEGLIGVGIGIILIIISLFIPKPKISKGQTQIKEKGPA